PVVFVDYLSEITSIELDGADQLTVVDGVLLAGNGTQLLLAADKDMVVIPATVKYIGDYALYGALSMKALRALPASEPDFGDYILYTENDYLDENKVVLYLPNSDGAYQYETLVDVYDFYRIEVGETSSSGSWKETSLTWKCADNTLTIEGVGEIPDGKDFVQTWITLGVKDVIVMDSVTKIGSNVFANLKATSFTISESVMVIGDNAFYGNDAAVYNFKSNLDLGNTNISSDATLNLQLTDKVDLAANVNTFDKVTLNRTFAAGATGTLILPFATTAPVGFKLYTIESYNNKVLTFADNGNAVQANTPYIYKNDSKTSWTPTANDVTLGNFEDMYEYSADGWRMCGVYQSKTETNNNADEASTLWVYTTSEGKDGNGFGKFKNYAKSVTVSPYRVFFKGTPYNEVYNSSNTVNSYAPERSLSVEFVDMDGTTSITEIIIDKDGNISSAAEDGAYYDLSGRRVENPTTGIYIVNGKKVLVK
ncbi:MAG: leucine-rich repeat protein, partial [Bacteroidaceae bacterium]|nr:leucine-rich repeat protein [Bacteroidaceae bacterium]